MKKIRVLVVDDSAFMRKMIREIIEYDPRFEIAGTARNGIDGIEKAKALKPDVITLDVEMPVMDGITALKKIMRDSPSPVVMLSSLTGNSSDATIEALSHGAVDFIAKPSGAISLDIENVQHEIITKIHTAAMSNISSSRVKQASVEFSRSKHQCNRRYVIGIGSSTGGPRALQHLLTDLPKNFPAPILIVQHMPAGFTKSLADRLDSLADIDIKEAVDGELLKNGTAYIAPGNRHMKLVKEGMELSIKLTDEGQRNGHRPSINTLFESMAVMESIQKVGVILTGMGSDGAAGIEFIMKNDAGSLFLAESEETAVVYGMPKAAAATNMVKHILPIQQIGKVLNQIVTS